MALVEKEKSEYSMTLKKIRDFYNGYRFSPKGRSVYNPYSTLLLLTQLQFEHHWFETGTPEFLVKLILKNKYDILTIPMVTDAIRFSTIEEEDLSLTPLLVQTGYLTIKDYDEKENLYTLDYPNFEVKDAFLNYLFRKILTKEEGTPYSYKLKKAFAMDDLEEVIEILREIFLTIDYDIQIPKEKYYQTIFYLIFTLLGFRIQTEVKTNRGRIDAVVESQSIYIFEFKLIGSKEEALSQIQERKYYEKYLSLGKDIYLVGVEFRERNLGEYVVEKIRI